MAIYKFTMSNGSTTKTERYEVDNYNSLVDFIESVTDLRVVEVSKVEYTGNRNFPSESNIKNVNVLFESNSYAKKIYVPRVNVSIDKLKRKLEEVKSIFEINDENVKKISGVEYYIS